MNIPALVRERYKIWSRFLTEQVGFSSNIVSSTQKNTVPGYCSSACFSHNGKICQNKTQMPLLWLPAFMTPAV